MNLSTIQSTIRNLEALVHNLTVSTCIKEKIDILNHYPDIELFLAQTPILKRLVSEITKEGELVVKSILVIGEGPTVFGGLAEINSPKDRLQSLIGKLWEVECFYKTIGGIVGYHHTFLKLLLEKEKTHNSNTLNYRFLKPPGIDISSENDAIRKTIINGLQHLPEIAEIYAVGGAGDRLNLLDSNNNPLPAAQLLFKGKTLLADLIQDLQAREWLYYKLYGKQIITPILMMTSHEKKNHYHILDICARNAWFGRPKEMFYFIVQPLVPVISEAGHWLMTDILKPILKPGGHGVIWKLALERGAFEWLESNQRKKVLVRQINNPIAGVDYGLLAFCGVGFQENKLFGFASCPRQVHTAEGVNVLIESQTEDDCEYRISNIEYTDFAQVGIKDVPEVSG